VNPRNFLSLKSAAVLLGAIGAVALTHFVRAHAEEAPPAAAAAAVTAPVTAPPPPVEAKVETAASESESGKAACLETVASTVRSQHRARLQGFCDRIARLPACTSHEGRPIPHADADGHDSRGKRILVLGMIHGDEPLSGEMALEWEGRLHKIEHRNSWRVIPLLNPDGLKRKTRMNAKGVDLNRNFPTKDWEAEAMNFWKKTSKQDPRRFPGTAAASEAETKCILAHIKEFKPDFIVSVHTPYHVLDFDGPKMTFPRYKDLPWRALGNFPGSLGRLMWKDFQIPVLTVELGATMVDAAQLQDIVGGFAIEASRRSGQKTAGLFEKLQ